VERRETRGLARASPVLASQSPRKAAGKRYIKFTFWRGGGKEPVVTHDELQSHLKAHHLVSQDHHARLCKAHLALASHFAETDPKCSAQHMELADCHKDAASYHGQAAESFGEDVQPDLKAMGGPLNELHKVLSGG